MSVVSGMVLRTLNKWREALDRTNNVAYVSDFSEGDISLRFVYRDMNGTCEGALEIDVDNDVVRLFPHCERRMFLRYEWSMKDFDITLVIPILEREAKPYDDDEEE